MSKLVVWVFKPKNRAFYQCQWIDPLTGRRKTKSTGTAIKREADKFAAQLDREIRAGVNVHNKPLTWHELADRYEREYAPGNLKPASLNSWVSTRKKVTELIKPSHAVSITAGAISKMVGEFRETGMEEPTIRKHLATLQACLRWAAKLGLIPTCPAIVMPKKISRSKGRPITEEEFDRMVAAVPKVIADVEHEWKWVRLLRGLWLSGFRLSEAMKVSWDEAELTLVPHRGEFRLKIEVEADKSNDDGYLPLDPAFQDFLRSTPESDRSGLVFPLSHPTRGAMHYTFVSRTVSEFGEKAGVIVSRKSRRLKFASAHDLRRSFATYWARQGMAPQYLQILMRHESIQTTMTFYVDIAVENAESVMKTLGARVSNTFSNTPDPDEATSERKSL